MRGGLLGALLLLLQGPPAHHHQNFLQLLREGQLCLWGRKAGLEGPVALFPMQGAPGASRRFLGLDFGGAAVLVHTHRGCEHVCEHVCVSACVCVHHGCVGPDMVVDS